MKHLVIDARWYGPEHTGIGRYTQNLIQNLVKIPHFFKHIRLTLLVSPQDEDRLRLELGNQINYALTRITHYSLLDQIVTPINLYRLRADLVHFTHIDKPILYFGQSLVTVHDLIKNFSLGPSTSTKNFFFYYFKQIGYFLVSHLTIKSNQLIVPSNYWRSFLITHYHLSPQKITTTHEAVDPEFLKLRKSYVINHKSYLLYTGNLYPHKNLDVVLKALAKLPRVKLKIISKTSVFLHRLQRKVKKGGLENQVEFLGFVPDQKFARLYRQAIAFVFPSLIEGFGLPPLEAMALGCPVISSNSSCCPEIYGSAALYFNPQNSDDLVNQINILRTNPKLRRQLITTGYRQIRKYSWVKTANLTFSVYRHLLEIDKN